MNVLVVDGNDSLRFTTVELIKGWGYQVESCTTGRDTLEALKKEAYDLVLLDVSLPEPPVRDLICQIKTIRPDIGIVTMTEQTTDELEKEIRTLGIIYYMCKPVNQEALKDILDHMSKRKNQDKGPD